MFPAERAMSINLRALSLGKSFWNLHGPIQYHKLEISLLQIQNVLLNKYNN